MRLKDALGKLVNPDIVFRTKNPPRDSYGRAEIIEVSILDLIQRYESYRRLTVDQLHRQHNNSIRFPEKIAHALTVDSPSQWQSGEEPRSPVSYYPQRVVTIGQLSIAKK